MKNIIKHIILLLTIINIAPSPAQAKEIKGRFSLENYFSKDSSSTHNYIITTARLRFDIEEIQDSNMNFHFNGSERIKSGKRDLNSRIPEHRINDFNFEYKAPTKKMILTTGRQNIEESVGSNVDGLNLKLSPKGKSSFGVFGGLKPDPYLDTFTSDYMTAGTYYQIEDKTYNGNIGLVHDIYKGGTDRDYLYLRSGYRPSKIISFRNSAIVDIGQGTEITNLTFGTDIRATSKLRLSANYFQFKAIKLKRSMSFDIDRNKQQRIDLRLAYKITRDLRVYTNYVYRIRSKDNKTAKKIKFGINGNLFDWELMYDLQYIKDSYFTADNDSYLIELQKTFIDKIDVGVVFEYEQNKSSFEDETQTLSRYNLFVSYYITKSLYLTVDYDYIKEKDFNSTTLFTKVGVRF